jgi:amino acid transporter
MPSVFLRVKRLLFGRPLPSERLEHEQLPKTTALAVLASDAISSVAYATEQILLALAILGTAALSYVVPISAVIAGLLVLVALSYRQTVFAYPQGGGSYTVARENLGAGSGLVAAAALLTDYTLTVAVSISAGVAAITSAHPALAPHAVMVGVGATLLLMLVNLRGVRESGIVFSVPTYLFIALMTALLGAGLYQSMTGHGVTAAVARPRAAPPAGFAFTLLLLRAFAGGCVAMTGTEAISNGVGAFRSPQSNNAAITLTWMATILAAFFLGASYLARHFHTVPSPSATVLSQLGRHVFGGGPLFFALQYATFALLVLAANTAFADFPRLSSLLARDGYVPRRFAARGDRLAFSNGIVALAVIAALLVVLFGGDTHALIPLYAVGVFVCFTLSQAGMVRHWLRTRAAGWRWKASLNGLGAAATGAVAVVQVATKFTEGAWIVVLVIPLLVVLLRKIHRHHEALAEAVAYVGLAPLTVARHTAVVTVSGMTKPAAAALEYASAIADDVRALCVEIEPGSAERVRAQWAEWEMSVPLTVVASPYRSAVRPLVDYVAELTRCGEAHVVTVVVPDVVSRGWWAWLLHGRLALWIQAVFLRTPNVVVTRVPYVLGAELPGAGRAVHRAFREGRLVSE